MLHGKAVYASDRTGSESSESRQLLFGRAPRAVRGRSLSGGIRSQILVISVPSRVNPMNRSHSSLTLR